MFHPQQSPGLYVASWELSAWLQVGTMMKQHYVEHVFKACTIKWLWLTTYTTQGCTWSSSPGRGMWAAYWDMLCGRLWISTWSRTRRRCCIFQRSRSARSLSRSLDFQFAHKKSLRGNWKLNTCRNVFENTYFFVLGWGWKVAGTWKHQILCGEIKRP